MKYIVVSLPRTGTTSICRMAAMVGFKAVHNPMGKIGEFDFYADTPYYDPVAISKLICVNVPIKFIWICRDPRDWFNSMEKAGLLKADDVTREHYMNAFGTDEVTAENRVECFSHYFKLMTKAISGRPCLDYSFSEGWKPFCYFVGKPIPDAPIPHLNKDGRIEARPIEGVA